MKQAFISVPATRPIVRANEHGGKGSIVFRRLLAAVDFEAPIDFVDYTIVPAGSTIGRHPHLGSEEMYFIIAGEPVIRVGIDEARLARGSLSIVRSGQSHELINDTDQDVEILVIQVRV